ncbi:MAG: metal ABC transporter ATP-binding protein [Thiolinea sp.]
MSDVIDLKNVSFSYDRLPVLEDISLQVAEREFLGIVGPNAGGKSTLLKLVLGLLKPQVGRIRILGKKPRQQRKAIGYVPQYPAFARDFPITVEQVVLMGRLGAGRLFGRYSAEDYQASKVALEEVEADDLAQRLVGGLSGGQLQRVLLARALVSDPQILILDEPTANIDMRLESDIFDQLKRLNARMTILVVSHDIAFISDYVHRVACLNRTLVCHHTDNIDGQMVQHLYGDNVRMVAHHHH